MKCDDLCVMEIVVVALCIIEIFEKNGIFAIRRDCTGPIIAVNFEIANFQSQIDINYHNPKIIIALTSI